jgi:hypothetical protein
MIRRLIPFTLAPLAVLASALAGSMWLRAFPAATLAVPLFGAALLSVLVATAVVRLTRRSMWLTLPVGLLAFVLYALVLVLRSPLDLADLISGFVNGPAQLLSFALPLVSPRSLMVWPVALCWLAGLLAGESLARSRLTLLPYGCWLVVFGVGYAGSSRAMGADATAAKRIDLAVGAALLLVMTLLRVAQSWLQVDAAAEATDDPQNVLPLQRILTGLGTALVVAVVAGYLASTSVFAGAPTELKRVPSVIRADPTTPLAYVASLRPASRTEVGTALFDVTVDRSTPGYLGIASVDYYDGDSWSFTRDFRPSGGVVPRDSDPDLDPVVSPVTQQYRIQSALIANTPWMPSIFRPEKISGLAVSIDPISGMVVPTGQLSIGQSYQVRSRPNSQTLSDLPASWLPATSAPPIDEQLPGQLRTALTSVIAGFATETGHSSTAPNTFLQAVVTDLRANYLLAQSNPSATSGPTGTARSAAAGTAIGGSSFAAVLAAILGPQRSGTPEQYATLCALLARDLGIPARVVSGFRAAGDHRLTTGTHTITTQDAYIWVEIPVRGAGWVVLDPSPSRYAATDAQPSVGVTRSNTPSRTPSQAALVTESAGGHAVAPKSAVKLQHLAGKHHRWYLIPVAAAVAGVLLILVLLGRRRVRLMRRRRVRDARRRVITAWQETLDVLEECGLGELSVLTGAEVSQAVDQRFGVVPAGHVRKVAAAADRAAFSEQIAIVARDADEAWTAHAAARKSVRRDLPLTDKVLSQVRYRSDRGLTRPAGRARVRRRRTGRRRKH